MVFVVRKKRQEFFRFNKFNKSAQGESFNWIFIIVAGAIILAFFSVFTIKFIQLKELQYNIEIGRNFAQSISVLEAAPVIGRERGIVIDDSDGESSGGFRIGTIADMKYSCVGNKVSVVFNNEIKSSQDLDKDILFAPSSMKINSLDLWILPWYFPFFVNNVVYLSDPNAEYYFVYDSLNENFVNDLYIPNNLKVKLLPLNKIDVVPGENARFVFFTNSISNAAGKIPGLAQQFKKSDFKYIKVNFAERGKDVGEVTFLDNSGKPLGSGKFYGLPLMWGAIFSDDFDVYNCGLGKSLNKIINVGDVYMYKSDFLSRVQGQACSSFYSAVKMNIAKLVGKDFEKTGYKSREAIENENIDLAGKGCAYVF